MLNVEFVVFFLLVVSASVVSQDFLTGDHVCKVETTETVEETILVPVTKTVRVEEWCFTNFPPRCFQYVNQTVNELQTRERVVKSFKTVCCEGFVQQDDRCIPNQQFPTTERPQSTTILMTTYSTSTISDLNSLETQLENLNKNDFLQSIDKTSQIKLNEDNNTKLNSNVFYIKKYPNLVGDSGDLNRTTSKNNSYDFKNVNNTIKNTVIENDESDTIKNINVTQYQKENVENILKTSEKDLNLAEEKTEHDLEKKLIELTKKINEMSDVSYINNQEFSDDYDINLIKSSKFEKSSKVPETDEATVELHLTTSKNVLLGFVLMIAIIILVVVFVIAFVVLKCLTIANVKAKNRPTSIFNVPLPDPPGPSENLYEPIKDNPEVISLQDLANERSKFNTLSGHYQRKPGLEGPKSPFFNTLPSAPRSVSYHGPPKAKINNTFELINPDQVAYDVPPSESRRFSIDGKMMKSDPNRFSIVSYVDMDRNTPLYVNHIKRQHFSTFINQNQGQALNPAVISSNQNDVNKDSIKITEAERVQAQNLEIKQQKTNLYSNEEVVPFLMLPNVSDKDILESLPGFRKTQEITYMNEGVTAFQEDS